jgi:chromosome segregation ATPase
MSIMGEVGLPFDEKKEETSYKEIKKPRNSTPKMPSSNAKKPARQDFQNAGLSELSKQLRIFQAKNEGQWIEINRLERQLRILADLQGISVADLRKALEDACADEAFEELQHRVASLRAQLEAAHLARQAELKKDAAAHQIATLELRIGELEEVEDVRRDEIRDLYEQLREEKARSTRLESSLEQQQSETQDLQKQLAQERARANRLQTHCEEQQFEIKSLKANPPPQAAENLKSMGAQEARARMQKEYEQMLRSVRDEEASTRRKMQAEHDTTTEWSKKKAG